MNGDIQVSHRATIVLRLLDLLSSLKLLSTLLSGLAEVANRHVIDCLVDLVLLHLLEFVPIVQVLDCLLGTKAILTRVTVTPIDSL